MGNTIANAVFGETSSRKLLIQALNRGNLDALREAISKVKASVYSNDGNKRKQAELMLGYFTKPLKSTVYPNCDELTPLEYARKLHGERLCNMTMVKEIEREIKTCTDRIERADKEWEADNARWEDGKSAAPASSSSATDSLIEGQIAYVKEQLRKGKITQKQADKKIEHYKKVSEKLNKKN